MKTHITQQEEEEEEEEEKNSHPIPFP